MDKEKLESELRQKLVVDEQIGSDSDDITDGTVGSGKGPLVEPQIDRNTIPESPPRQTGIFGNKREPALIKVKNLKSRRPNKDANLTPQARMTRKAYRWLALLTACIAIIIVPIAYAAFSVLSQLNPNSLGVQFFKEDWPTEKTKMRHEISGTTDLSRNLPTLLSNFGEALILHKEYEEALAVFKHCQRVTAGKSNWFVYTQLQIATCEHFLHQKDSSVKLDFDKTIEAMKMGKTMKSEQWRTAALAAILGNMYADIKDFTTAESYFNEADDLFGQQSAFYWQNEVRQDAWKTWMTNMSTRVSRIKTVPGSTLTISKGETKNIGQEATALLNAQKYQELEDLIEKYSKTRVQKRSGHEAIDSIFEALSNPSDQQQFSWNERLRQLELWVTQKPKSATPHVVLANFYIKYAWNARGTGWANSVSDTQWNMYRERLYKSTRQLQMALALGPPSPSWFSVAQVNILGAGDDEDKKLYEALSGSGNRLYPDYVPIYLNAVHYLQPRWHGEGQEWVDYANKAADAVGGDEGDKLYARMVANVDKFFTDIYKEAPKLSRKRVERGKKLLDQQFRTDPSGAKNSS
ncbi:MAG: DUF4034 domain-containing protein [Cyanobacteria bacterium SZAS LIN-5]|nr:DUF4034 domain-containing protein [Cyanobacteria bacterium SZAS LIN-5]